MTEHLPSSGRSGTRHAWVARMAALAIGLNGLLFVAPIVVDTATATTGCGLHYVAGGDDVPAGNEVSSSQTYPSHLYTDHLSTFGAWCTYALAANGTTSSSYISGGQMATSAMRQPDLVTLTLGEQNSSIVDLIDSCYQKIKDNDFTGATTCAVAVSANSSAFSSLTTNLTTMFGMYKTIMAGRPRLVVAVTGYSNPYPAATDAITNLLVLCPKLIDTVATCITRWGQLPMALTAIDLAIQHLNSTIKNAVAPFATGSAGRFVYVDTYTKTRSHCMKMDVSIKTSVNHSTFSDEHDSDQDFGCSSPWYVAQSDVSTIPTYLEPAADGVLITETQQVSGMGIHLNDDGQKCVSDLIWNAPTIDGTPLKWKLGVPEAVNTNVCS